MYILQIHKDLESSKTGTTFADKFTAAPPLYYVPWGIFTTKIRNHGLVIWQMIQRPIAEHGASVVFLKKPRWGVPVTSHSYFVRRILPGCPMRNVQDPFELSDPLGQIIRSI